MKPSTAKISSGVAAVAAVAALAGCATTQTKTSPRSEAKQTYAVTTMPVSQAERVAAQAQPVKSQTLVIKTSEEHARKGPEGQWHDAFLPASFSVSAGQRVDVTVYNYDEGEHSFTSPAMGLNVTFEGGGESSPHRSTFSFVAPRKVGRYEWFCAYPCDPWSMAHIGYMRGYVTVST
jgi:plastocyanin